MNNKFETYVPRKIEFQELILIKNWNVKVYTISLNYEFKSRDILKNVIENIPHWTAHADNSEISTYGIAFLIVHEAREGVWILFSWWTGGEMIETKVYFTNYKSPSIISTSPYESSSLVCVWELEIFIHEREAWIEHVLKCADNPDFKGYLLNTLKTHENI